MFLISSVDPFSRSECWSVTGLKVVTPAQVMTNSNLNQIYVFSGNLILIRSLCTMCWYKYILWRYGTTACCFLFSSLIFLIGKNNVLREKWRWRNEQIINMLSKIDVQHKLVNNFIFRRRWTMFWLSGLPGLQSRVFTNLNNSFCHCHLLKLYSLA